MYTTRKILISINHAHKKSGFFFAGQRKMHLSLQMHVSCMMPVMLCTQFVLVSIPDYKHFVVSVSAEFNP
jgi:hypothetical protein